MELKSVVYEDYVNYRKPSMFIGTCRCDWKCCRDDARCKCQNSGFANYPSVSMDDSELLDRYIGNPLTHAVVFGGLEPMLQFDEVVGFVGRLREKCDDDVVIYTGYYEDEIAGEIERLREFRNVVVKFGRFIPCRESRFDEVLGVTLASDNQYARRIS